MEEFRKKKRFGQHFLHDANISKKIAASLNQDGSTYQTLIEIGPGQGSLTRYLMNSCKSELHLCEVDDTLIPFLKTNFPSLSGRIHHVDFLKLDLQQISNKPIGIIGNFPYNISSQILFKVLENRKQIPELVGMFQKELAERIASEKGSKVYGSISVLIQTFYTVELLFNVSKNVFSPPPKVESAVIRLSRKNNSGLISNEKLYFGIVKQAFGQRRKTLRNSLKSFHVHFNKLNPELLQKRPEQLAVEDFIHLSEIFSSPEI